MIEILRHLDLQSWLVIIGCLLFYELDKARSYGRKWNLTRRGLREFERELSPADNAQIYIYLPSGTPENRAYNLVSKDVQRALGRFPKQTREFDQWDAREYYELVKEGRIVELPTPELWRKK